jgi:hypothetical protein
MLLPDGHCLNSMLIPDYTQRRETSLGAESAALTSLIHFILIFDVADLLFLICQKTYFFNQPFSFNHNAQ